MNDFAKNVMACHKISIIVPVFNVEKYLSWCLDSVIAQTFTDWECILVDDGSTDNSGTICDEYAAKDSRFRVLHKTNGGVSSARNLGIEKAKGSYVCFLDSDDYVHPYWLEGYSRCLNVDLAICSCVKIFPEGDSYSYAFPEKGAFTRTDVCEMVGFVKCIPQLGWNLWGYPWNKLFKRDIIIENHIRFVEGISLWEDEIFVWNYFRHVRSIKLVHDSYVYHIMGNANGLSQRSISTEESLLLAQETRKLYDVVKDNTKLLNLIKGHEAGWYLHAAKYADASWLTYFVEHVKLIYTIRQKGIKGYVKVLYSIYVTFISLLKQRL